MAPKDSDKENSLASSSSEQQSLIPGLPDDIALNCLIHLPPSPSRSSELALSLHFHVVCRRWRKLARSPEFFLSRKAAGIAEEWLCAFTFEFVERKRLVPFEHEARPQVVRVKVGGIAQERPVCFDKNWWPGSEARVVLRVLSTRRPAWAEVPVPHAIARCRDFRTAVVGCPQRLYVVGGSDGKETTGAVWIYTPACNRWSRGRPMTVPRSRFACGVLRNGTGEELIVVAGGNSGAGGAIFGRQAKWTAEVYSPRSDTWRPLPTLPQPHVDAQGVLARGTFHVIDTSGRVTALNSETGNWMRLPRNRYSHGVAPPLWPHVEVGDQQWALDRADQHRLKIFCQMDEPVISTKPLGGSNEWVPPPVDIYVWPPAGPVRGLDMPFQLVNLGGKPVIVSADLKATLILWTGGARSPAKEDRRRGKEEEAPCRVLSHGLQHLSVHGHNTRLVAVAALEV